MNEVQPLNPQVLEQSPSIPNVVIAVVNQLIKKNWNGQCSAIRVNDIIGFVGLVANYPIEVIMSSNWIDSIKVLYEEAGYIVSEFNSNGNQYLEFKKNNAGFE